MWAQAQGRQSSRHGAKRRAPDVEEVDLLDAGEDDGNAERFGEDDFAQRFARGREEHLRIVEPLGQIVGIKNDCGDADGPGERPAPDLVDACDPSMAVGESLALEVEMGRGRHRARRRRGLFPYGLHAARHESRLSFSRKLSQARRARQGGKTEMPVEREAICGPAPRRRIGMG